MTRLLKYVILLCCFNTADQAFAQLNHRYDFRYLDQSDGLLHTEIISIEQDSRGFIWVLTQNGLQRYDGSRFVSYPDLVQTTYNIMSGRNMYIDTLTNYAYIMQDTQVNKLDLSTNKLTLLSHTEWMNEGDQPHIFSTEKGDTWKVNSFGIQNRNTKIDKREFNWINKNPGQHGRENYFLYDSISGLFYGHEFNHLLLGDPNKGIIYTANDKDVNHPMLLKIRERSTDFKSIKSLMIDSRRQLWIITWTNLLFRYDLNADKLFTYDLKDLKKEQTGLSEAYPNLLITAVFEDKQNNVWFATDNVGLLLFDHATDNFNYITTDNNIRNGIRYNFGIRTIFQDRQDNIWLGTDKGISIFNPSGNYFRSIHHIEGNELSLPRYDINDVIETVDGEIMIATWGGGIAFYDKDLKFIRNQVFTGSYEVNLIWSLVQRDNGTIWAGTQHGFIHEYDPIAKKFTTFQPPETEFSTIRAMVKDRDGNIFMGLHNGRVATWDESEQKFYSYKDNHLIKNIQFSPVANLIIDEQNQCWVASEKEIKEFNFSIRGYTAVHNINSDPKNTSTTLQGLEQLNDSILLVGSIYGGLDYFNKHTGKVSSTHKRHDDLSVFAIKKDDRNQIWFTTNYNLYRMDPEGNTFTNFTINPDMINASFGGNKMYVLSDGRWMTFTPAEVIFFDPLALSQSGSLLPRVEISEFSIFDEMINIDSFLAYKAPLELSYDQNFISVHFAALDFTKLTEVNYFYRLAGVDKKWNDAHGKNFATYTDLKPGDYIFEVRSENGFNSSPVTSFAFTVAAPWWATWWMRLLAVGCLVAITLILYKSRIRTIRQEASLKHKIAETEMMALRSQMNPHFIFNCINGIDAMIQSNDKYRATMYLNKFAKLIRNVLDSSTQNKVPLSKDIETLQLYLDLELFRHEGKFTANIEASDELIENDYAVPPLIIQPYVENAILHGLRKKSGDGGRLNITVTKENEHIVYVVEDNGIGRNIKNGHQNKNGHGYGMQIGNDRVRLFNNEEIASVDVTDLIENDKPTGTRIKVKLKIQ